MFYQFDFQVYIPCCTRFLYCDTLQLIRLNLYQYILSPFFVLIICMQDGLNFLIFLLSVNLLIKFLLISINLLIKFVLLSFNSLIKSFFHFLVCSDSHFVLTNYMQKIAQEPFFFVFRRCLRCCCRCRRDCRVFGCFCLFLTTFFCSYFDGYPTT